MLNLMLQFGEPFLSISFHFLKPFSVPVCLGPSIEDTTSGKTAPDQPPDQPQRSSTDSPQIVLKTAFIQTLLFVRLCAQAKLYLSRTLPLYSQTSFSKTT